MNLTQVYFISDPVFRNRSFVGGDGLHPTEAGYQRMSDWFRATVEQAFAVRSAFQ